MSMYMHVQVTAKCLLICANSSFTSEIDDRSYPCWKLWQNFLDSFYLCTTLNSSLFASGVDDPGTSSITLGKLAASPASVSDCGV